MSIFKELGAKYIEKGISVIPVNGKRPIIKEWSKYCDQLPNEFDIVSWEKIKHSTGIGVCLGKASKLIAIDIDYDDTEFIEIVKNALPVTLIYKTGVKGLTLFYKHCDEVKSSKILHNKRPVVEILSTNNQTIIPPSLHPEGVHYKWGSDYNLLNYDIDDVPPFTKDLVNKLEKIVSQFFSKKEPLKIMNNGRHNSIVGYGFAVFKDCQNISELSDKLFKYDQKKHPENPYFTDPMENKGLTGIEYATKIAKSITQNMKNKKNIDFTDKQENNSEISVEDAFKVRFCKQGKSKVFLYNQFAEWARVEWHIKSVGRDYLYLWNDDHWVYADDMTMMSKISKVVAGAPITAQLKEFLDTLKRELMTDSPTEPERLLNIENGILDLQPISFGNEPVLMPKSIRYFFKSKGAEFSYRPEIDYETPAWNKFVDEVFMGDQDSILRLSQMMGYAIFCGDMSLHKAIVFLGDGRNGKSLIVEIIHRILGKRDDSDVINTSVSFLPINKLGDQLLASALYGKYLNVTEEAPERINSEVFKNLVSGGLVNGRELYKKTFQFKNKAKILLCLNNMPVFSDKNNSISQRLEFLFFPKSFTDAEIDPHLINKLLPELPGILQFAINGLKSLLLTNNFHKCRETSEEVTIFEDTADDIAVWFENRCIYEKTSTDWVSSKKLWANFYQWSIENNCDRFYTSTKFYRKFTQVLRKLTKTKAKSEVRVINNIKARCYIGVRLVNDI